MKTKKAQGILFSSMLALFIFFLVVTLFANYLFDAPKITSQNSELLEKQAQRAADNLLSEGYPQNWNLNTVKKIGLLTNESLDEKKLLLFENLVKTQEGYQRSKALLGIQYDYIVTIRNQTLGDNTIANENELIAANKQEIITKQRMLLDNRSRPITLKINIYK